MRFSELVADWGGFEKFVAELNKTSELVSVEHDVKLRDRLGVERQIDVLVTHRQGLYTYKTLIECKCWNSSVKRTQIDAMATAMEHLGAARGVFFTTKGFQSGAIETARSSNIDLFLVRELSDAEWGSPGRVINFRLCVFERGLDPHIRLNFLSRSQSDEQLAARLKLNLNFSVPNILLWHADDDSPADPLEKSVADVSLQQLEEFVSGFPAFHGDNVSHIFDKKVELRFKRPRKWVNPENRDQDLIINAILVRFLFRVRQSEFSVDRSKKFPIAHAIEDCISGAAYIASRRDGEKFVTQERIPVERLRKTLQEQVMDIRVSFANWFECPKEMAGWRPYIPPQVREANEGDSPSQSGPKQDCIKGTQEVLAPGTEQAPTAGGTER